MRDLERASREFEGKKKREVDDGGEMKMWWSCLLVKSKVTVALLLLSKGE